MFLELRIGFYITKTVNLPIWAFSSNFLYDFTLFVIDIHQNMPISLFKTLFDHFHFYPFVKLIWRVILICIVVKNLHFWTNYWTILAYFLSILFWPTVQHQILSADMHLDSLAVPVNWIRIRSETNPNDNLMMRRAGLSNLVQT